MGIKFDDLRPVVMADSGMDDTSRITPEMANSFIRDGYHELLHGLTSLRNSFDETTGIMTYRPEVLSDDVVELPDFMDEWATHLKHYIKWRIMIYSRMDQAQAARAKLELESFQNVFHTNDVGNR